MSKLTKNEELELLADFHTGRFSQRQLSKKYNISLGKVNNLTKGIVPKNEHLLEPTKTVLKAKEEISDKEMNAIVQKAKEELNAKEIVCKATYKNLSFLIKKIDEGSSIVEHKIIQDTIDKASLTLGVNQRHNNQQISLTNATQNNIEINKEMVQEALMEFEEDF